MERANPRRRRGGGVKRNVAGGNNLSPRLTAVVVSRSGEKRNLGQRCSDLAMTGDAERRME